MATSLSGVSDRAVYALAAAISVAALAAIAYVLLVRSATATSVDLSFLRPLNAALNATAATLLVLGWRAIRRGARRTHHRCMLGAFAASTLFLVSYLTYHYVHGDTRFGGDGALRIVYLGILASHVLLSMAIVPLAVTTLFFAARATFDRHRRIARVTLPIWLYVSVTGVVVYVMLRAWGAAAA